MLPYPKPQATGGKLIRDVIGLFKKHGLKLPINSHILIATSGGADSIALAHLIIKYGRRVVDPTQITLLHINHGWRGKESDDDARFVKAFGKRLNVPVRVHKLKPPKTPSKGESLEDLARQARKKIYAQEIERLSPKSKKTGSPAVVLTAHHGDDLAETLLWRIFTGAADTHGGGIAVRLPLSQGEEIRPFLSTRKETLKRYLKEEGETWREDRTNGEGRFLRSKMRLELMPVVEKLFPRAIEHLMKLALRVQLQPEATDKNLSHLSLMIGALGLAKARRPHWEWIQSQLRAGQMPGKNHLQVDLPEGWKLRLERPKQTRQV